ncbi:MAG: rod shape-determining protein MreC [Eubacterium sp.]|nr:rod shape-determining protein MreC [Eubacterium sp.]
MKKKKNNKQRISSGYIFFFAICIFLVAIFTTTAVNSANTPFNILADTIFTPFQNGINKLGSGVYDFTANFTAKKKLIAENEELQAQVDELTIENNELVLQVYELDTLKELYELDNEYSEYEKIGAYVIGKDTGNWFDTFTINKGSADGVSVDMNVIAGSGLVGIVTKVGLHNATVRSIIDDTSSVSAMVLNTSDNFIVSGSLSSMDESGVINFTNLKDTDDEVTEGAAITTSFISDKYLPGLLIGYINEISLDANKLTKSGTITPCVDFEHLQEVLVILDLKEDSEVTEEE